MSIDLAALAKSVKGTPFEAKTYNKGRHPREVVYDALVGAENAWDAGEAHPFLKTDGEQTALTIRYGSTPVPLNETGDNTNVFDDNVFDKVLAKVQEQVKAGEYDDVLERLKAKLNANLAVARAKKAAKSA